MPNQVLWSFSNVGSEMLADYKQACEVDRGTFAKKAESGGNFTVTCTLRAAAPAAPPAAPADADVDAGEAGEDETAPDRDGGAGAGGAGVAAALLAAPSAAPPGEPPRFSASAFLQEVRAALVTVSEEASEGLLLVVSTAAKRGVTTNRLAYMLATAWWETARTMQPVREAFWVPDAENWRKRNLRYYPYYGRGYVQLTHEANYRKASAELGVDLVADPDLALRKQYAVPILFAGMEQGWFTGRKLDDYIDDLDEPETEELREFEEARRIINGVDKKTTIARIAMRFRNALRTANYRPAASGAAAPAPSVSAEVSGLVPTGFAEHIARLGLRHFRAAEFLVKGSRHDDPGSRAFGLNTDPPEALWQNVNVVAVVLDRFRASVARPIVISSAYRSRPYNEAIGGAPDSRHVHFNALDFVVRGSPVGPAEWAAELRQMRAAGMFSGGIGVYPTFVHVDARGEDRDWTG